MRLVDLEPQFIRYEVRTEKWTRVLGDPSKWKPGDPTEEVTGPRVYHPYVDDLKDAQGIRFLCPKCFRANNGPVGTHSVICWFRDRYVPDDADPRPGRWQVIGTGYHDLTLHPSILLPGSGCQWHGYITNGQAT